MNDVKTKTMPRARQLTLLQTRASGFPSQKIRDDSIQQWIDTVTSDPSEEERNPIEVSELESYVRDTFSVNAFTVRNTHVSIGVSSCLENRRALDGKTGMARALIAEERSCRRVDLETGDITEEIILADEFPGEFLLHFSLLKYLEGYPKMLKVKVAGIDEVGMKYRIITIPSFYHSSIISPWAHLTYQWLKTSCETRSGVSGTNHAWEASLALTASDPNLNWLFGPERVLAFNSDLEQATDYELHEAISAMLDVAQAVMPVQDWYFGVVKHLLSSPRTYTLLRNGIKEDGTTTRGCFMGDHGTKTVLTLSGLYALAGMKFNRLSRLVGDDQWTVSVEEKAYEALEVYSRRIHDLGLKVSEDDTFVSDTSFFAEEGFLIPDDPGRTTEVWLGRKIRNQPPFLDVPKVKIMSDCGKDLGLFSDTAIGKITLLGKRMEHSGKTFLQGTFHLASWIQDICMSLIYRKEFVYFPRFLVQTGKPPLFGCKRNVKSFLVMQRCGRLQSPYADIMEAALRPVRHSRRIIQSFFTHGAGDETIRITEREFPTESFHENLVLTNESVRGFAPFLLTRLHSKVMSESELVAKLAERENLLGEKVKIKSLTVANLARGKATLTDELLTEFIDKWFTNSKLLRLRVEERYYDREAIEEKLGNTHPLRVTGLLKPLPLEEKATITRSEHDRQVNALWRWVQSNPCGLDRLPQALIRDDLLLLSENLQTIPRLLVVSDDIKLVNAYAIQRGMNWRATRETFHISINNWVLSDLTARGEFSPDEVWVDEGSLDGYLDNLDALAKEPPDPDGQPITGRYRPVRPTGNLVLPFEVIEANQLLGELRTIEE